MKKFEVSKETLQDLFINKKMSQQQIANILGTSKNTIIRRLKEYGIEQSEELKNEKKSLFQKKDLGITKEELEDLYINQNKSIKDLCAKFDISKSYLMRLLKEYNIRKPKSLEIENRSKTMIERYGAPTAFQSKELRTKIENTNLERYGAKNPYASKKVREKIKKTNLERYGVEYYCETEHARENNKPYKISKINKEFSDILTSLNINNDLEFSIEHKSYDIKVDNTLIEIDPTFTHNTSLPAFSNEHISIDYHLNKTKLANENGFNCIHVFDWDDKDKIINMFLPKSILYARQCEVKEISLKEANDFLNLYHLQNGLMKQDVCLGLFK